MLRRRLLCLLPPLVLIAPLAACQLLVGFGELTEASQAGEAGPDTSTVDGTGTMDGSTEDAPPVCAPDASFESDSKNCGRCGHDCLGGACNDGGCQPVMLTDGQPHIHWLTVDSTSIAWTDGQNVRACPKASCGSVTPITSGREGVREVATGGGRVFWSECVSSPDAGGGVFGCPATGCASPAQPLWAENRCVTPQAYDAVHDLLYWGADDFIYRCSPSSCSASALVLADKQYAYVNSISLADDHVYWIESARGLSGCTSSLCTPTGFTLRAGSSVLASAPASIVGPNAFWSSYTTDYPTAYLDPAAISLIKSGGFVHRAPLAGDGGDSEVFANGGSPTAVVADEGAVRFTDFMAGAILSCPATGCDGGPTFLAIGQGRPFALVQDETAIYWANYDDGRIMKLAK